MFSNILHTEVKCVHVNCGKLSSLDFSFNFSHFFQICLDFCLFVCLFLRCFVLFCFCLFFFWGGEGVAGGCIRHSPSDESSTIFLSNLFTHVNSVPRFCKYILAVEMITTLPTTCKRWSFQKWPRQGGGMAFASKILFPPLPLNFWVKGQGSEIKKKMSFPLQCSHYDFLRVLHPPQKKMLMLASLLLFGGWTREGRLRGDMPSALSISDAAVDWWRGEGIRSHQKL